MKEILFLEPVFKSMIWGGDRLRTEYNYKIPSDHTGECWAISAHPNGDCTIKSGSYKGKSLSWLWTNKGHLFGNRSEPTFPLLIKIIDAKKDLSIQVHPDDAYAASYESGSYGKTECWYVLDCDKDAEIVIGHNAKDKDELRNMIEQERWSDLIRRRPIKRGDFFQISPGTVHAIKGGTMILETQQNSDITFRLYDYDRLDGGKPRQLHIKESIDVINCPHKDAAIDGSVIKCSSGEITNLIRNKHYRVQKIDLYTEMVLNQDRDFMNISVIEGEGVIDGTYISKGDHFILPYEYGSFRLEGKMSLIISYK
ncbi:MAG: class I mannose-6-phosphate isomerase [Clostridiales bacterium]|jgi:mannose-6-phosphate isomerase class I|nr:class I mannose-6-phosphate isomerase [Clostridiales bacterium]